MSGYAVVNTARGRRPSKVVTKGNSNECRYEGTAGDRGFAHVVSALVRFALVWLVLLLPSSAPAQEPDRSRFASDVVKRVVFDPTTYAPAVVAWTATRLDWKSSQVFFQNGFVEDNARFTISGRPTDIPITYTAGNRKILGDAIANLQISVINNVSGPVIERLLTRRFPNHRKIVRAIGWVERSSMGAYLSYRLAGGHFRQWQDNKRNGRELGL